MGTINPTGNPRDQIGEPSAGSVPGERRTAATDRRVQYDRREMIRFEEDRRGGVDRRAGNNDPWTVRIGAG